MTLKSSRSIFSSRIALTLFVPCVLATHAAAIEVTSANYSYTLPDGWVPYSYPPYVTLDQNWMVYPENSTTIKPEYDSIGGVSNTAEKLMDKIAADVVSGGFEIGKRSVKNIGGRAFSCLEYSLKSGSQVLNYYDYLTVQGMVSLTLKMFGLDLSSKDGEMRVADLESALARLKLNGISAGIRVPIRPSVSAGERAVRDILGRSPLDLKRHPTTRLYVLSSEAFSRTNP
ncbi:MAG: hypothetical protein ABI036_13850 [Fibrobacteria bacterium]